MKVIDFFRRKKQSTLQLITPDYEEQIKLINEEIEHFFPTEGDWSSTCYERSNELTGNNLPCHLRDNEWISRFMSSKIEKKGYHIPTANILGVINESKRFTKLRHDYELEIVRWQIDWMSHGGGNWLMPEGYDEISLLISTSVDKMFRKGVVKTLTAIGMNRDVIEEGIEKNRDMWLDKYMQLSFDHAFNPIFYDAPQPAKASDEHKKAWLDVRKYEYYEDHKKSVDLYGEATPEMKMSQNQYIPLKFQVRKWNNEREKFLESYAQSIRDKAKPVMYMLFYYSSVFSTLFFSSDSLVSIFFDSSTASSVLFNSLIGTSFPSESITISSELSIPKIASICICWYDFLSPSPVSIRTILPSVVFLILTTVA